MGVHDFIYWRPAERTEVIADVLGSDNAAEQPMFLSDHTPPAAQPPQDMQKAFKAEWEALEVVDHHWALADCEMRLLTDSK
ncbi:hypothetical protein AHF37_11117 [Paragonimus kellicotti]|nr:hypothetical protein AHF37_11117 [Paragonimus kellicotti]